MPSNHNCPFCLENGKVNVIVKTKAAFLVAPIDPSTGLPMPGRYLIIPTEHVENVMHLPGDWQIHVWSLFVYIPEYNAGVSFNLSYNQGRAAGQRVPHVHGWLIFRDDNEKGTEAYELGLNALIEKCKCHSTV